MTRTANVAGSHAVAASAPTCYSRAEKDHTVNSELSERSLLICAARAWDEAERRFDRAADAVLVAMIAWAQMREARRRLLERKPVAKVHQRHGEVRDAA